MMFAKLLARDIRLGFVRLLPYYIGAVLLGAVLGFGAVALSKVAIGDAAASRLATSLRRPSTIPFRSIGGG